MFRINVINYNNSCSRVSYISGGNRILFGAKLGFMTEFWSLEKRILVWNALPVSPLSILQTLGLTAHVSSDAIKRLRKRTVQD